MEVLPSTTLRRRLWSVALLLSLVAAGACARERPRIAIIIDDLGNGAEAGRGALSLPGALTYSILPHTPHARDLAQQAHASGREVMLHLPMQANSNKAMGPGGLYLGMGEAEFVRTLQANLDAVPHVAGVNNHMGSRLTRDPVAMGRVMAGLRERGLFFVDSRTTGGSIAEQTAARSGLATTRRHLFLDNQPSRPAVRRQYRKLLALARRQGAALAIGHPHKATLTVLARELPRLPQLGIDLVPASELTEKEPRRHQWHASSSPLLKVAKSSKP